MGWLSDAGCFTIPSLSLFLSLLLLHTSAYRYAWLVCADEWHHASDLLHLPTDLPDLLLICVQLKHASDLVYLPTDLPSASFLC